MTSEYRFDKGLDIYNDKKTWIDFKHNFEIDINSIIEFDRKNPNISPKVNLKPIRRYQRIYSKDDFLKSIENLKNNTIKLSDDESKEEHHLKNEIAEGPLKEINKLIHQMNKGKKLEKILAKVFRNIPNVVDVYENGSGWRSDHGADLIITVKYKIS